MNTSTQKLKTLAKVYNGATPKSDNADFWDGDIAWATPVDLGCSKYVKSTKRNITTAGHKSCNTTLLEPGNIVISNRAPIGLVAINDIPICTNQGCKLLELDKSKVNESYLYYVLKSSEEKLNNLGTGTTFMEISSDTLKNFEVPYIELGEQIVLADYLDTKTAIIDKMIAAKNHTHTQLLDLRQAIITNAVLGRGAIAMNPRQTNVPWIGAVPDHWQVKKIKHVAIVKARIGWQALTTDEYIDDGPYLVTGTDFHEGAVNWKTAAHVSDQRWAIDSNIQLEEDDLLLTKDGTIGKVAMVKDLHGKATLNSGVFVIRAKSSEYNPRYLYYVLNSGVFNDFIEYMKTGSTINHLYQQTFVEFSFPLPPRSEQDKIVEDIEKKLAKVDNALARVTSSTKLLEEYRSSLISNVVGGKVEV